MNLFLLSSFLGWWTCSFCLLFFICIYHSVLLFVVFSLPLTFYKVVFVFFYRSQIYIGDGKVPHSCGKKPRLEVYFWMTAVRLLKPLKGHHSICSVPHHRFLLFFISIYLCVKTFFWTNHYCVQFLRGVINKFTNFSDTASLFVFCHAQPSSSSSWAEFSLISKPTGQEYLFFANILTYTQCNLAKIKLSQVTFTLTDFSLFSY